MLIVLSLFFFVVWLVFLKFKWLPFNRTWKITIWTVALVICLVVLGALQYYTPASQVAVVSAHTQHIYPLVSGRVDQVFVKNAQKVSAGDKLFSIDPRPFQYAVDNWTASLRLAEIAFDDAQNLVGKGAIAKITDDQYRADRDKAKAQLDTAKFNLENSVVFAPADGVVSLVALRPGQSLSTQSIALNFISTNEVWITAVLKQNGMRLVQPGQQVSVTFNSLPGTVYQSKVELIPDAIVQGQITVEDANDPVQAVSSVHSGYPVRVAFPDGLPQEMARIGSLAEVTVFTSEGNPINVLAKILQWISTWTDYIA